MRFCLVEYFYSFCQLKIMIIHPFFDKEAQYQAVHRWDVTN